jgi:hypothetical protein
MALFNALKSTLAADSAIADIIGADGVVYFARIPELQSSEFTATATGFINILPGEDALDRDRDANGVWVFKRTTPVDLECFLLDNSDSDSVESGDELLFTRLIEFAQEVLNALFVRKPALAGVSIDNISRIGIEYGVAVGDDKIGAAKVTLEVQTTQSLEWNGQGAHPLTRINTNTETTNGATVYQENAVQQDEG